MRYSQDYKPDTHWLDPLNRMIFQSCFKHRTSQAKLRDGRLFKLTYTPDGLFVKVKPTYGLVPMGTFALKTVLDKSWVGDED